MARGFRALWSNVASEKLLVTRKPKNFVEHLRNVI